MKIQMQLQLITLPIPGDVKVCRTQQCRVETEKVSLGLCFKGLVTVSVSRINVWSGGHNFGLAFNPNAKILVSASPKAKSVVLDSYFTKSWFVLGYGLSLEKLVLVLALVSIV